MELIGFVELAVVLGVLGEEPGLLVGGVVEVED